MSDRFGIPPRASRAPAVPSVVFPAVGMARRVVVAAGVDVDDRFVDAMIAEGLAVTRVESLAAARAFTAERMPAALILGGAEEEELTSFVRWMRLAERLAFVGIFVVPARFTTSALRAGADDAFDVLDADAAQRIAARVDRAHSLSQLALIDALTLLHNRRFMNDRLDAELSRAARSRKPFSIALLDLDDFKRVNDDHGHAAGDRVLASFARALRRDLRAYDVPCRFGGDEFVVLFPDCDACGANAALDKVRDRASWNAAGLPAVTFSAGIAAFPDDGPDWPALFEAADRRALEAKDARRGFQRFG